MGRPVKGYEDNVCLLTHEAAEKLIKVQDYLDKTYGDMFLKIFDAYRPHMSVEDFRAWIDQDSSETMKSKYYPSISKHALADLGYLGVEQSTHSRGSTVDLTICKQVGDQCLEMDMGTCFDFFDELSHTKSNQVTATQKQNRAFLCRVMEQHGFANFPLEWWHFTLVNEPYPETYFNFPVKNIQGLKRLTA